ncbi:hypothetical protein PVK06_035785 [Gossypium arboreum]|uniref:Uncharacterized protein n=1 Tax=Gossypium arboreum TaxID=29729 RepID=A0ABR0NK13_GOSAR|nr:hypothetical protein PVK06_035785 [Gossypium arboreum]
MTILSWEYIIMTERCMLCHSGEGVNLFLGFVDRMVILSKPNQIIVLETATLRKVFKYLLMDEEVQGYKELNLDNGFEQGEGSKPWNESFPYDVKDVIAQIFRGDIPEPWNFLEFKEII